MFENKPKLGRIQSLSFGSTAVTILKSSNVVGSSPMTALTNFFILYLVVTPISESGS